MRQDVAAKALPRAQLVNLGLTGHRFTINLLVLIFKLKKFFFRSGLRASLVLAAFGMINSFAQAPTHPDKIMTIAELRTCMRLEQANKRMAAEILRDQEGFKRDQDVVKVEQAAVGMANEEIRARAAVLNAERDAISALAAGLPAKAEAAKTDAEKADFAAERAKIVERNSAYQQDADRFNATKQAQEDRVSAFNERVDAINARNKTINDRVEPHQNQVATWRDLCGKRRFREEDEVVVKKELAAGQ